MQRFDAGEVTVELGREEADAPHLALDDDIGLAHRLIDVRMRMRMKKTKHVHC